MARSLLVLLLLASLAGCATPDAAVPACDRADLVDGKATQTLPNLLVEWEQGDLIVLPVKVYEQEGATCLAVEDYPFGVGQPLKFVRPEAFMHSNPPQAYADVVVQAADRGLFRPSPSTFSLPVYSFAGTVTGASPPHPMNPGGGAEQLPLAKVDSFEAPANATELRYEAAVGGGAGTARIEVYAPDGTVAFSSLTQTACAVALCVFDPTVAEDGKVLPGAYEVRYYVGGSFDLGLTVEAAIPYA